MIGGSKLGMGSKLGEGEAKGAGMDGLHRRGNMALWQCGNGSSIDM